MSAARRIGQALGVTASLAAGAAASAYVAQRAVRRGLDHRPDPDADQLGPLPADDTRALPSHDGGGVATASRGHGPPILLSHGVTITSQVFVKQFQALPDAGVRVVTFDHRGHGGSVVGTTGHSVENLAADVRTVVEALDLRDAILVGHSMGGVAVQAFALEHPDVRRERVRGIVLLSTLAKTSISTSRRLRYVAEQVTGRLDLRRLMSRPEVGTLFARIGFGQDPQASHVELNRQMLAACDTATAREATAALLGLDLTDRLPSLDVPTLVIGGTHDVITPLRESRRLAELIPGARLEVIAGAGHMIMLERADELDRLLLDFARELGVLPARVGAA